MVHVTVEYCVPCGHLGHAVEVQRALLETYGRNLDGVALVPGEGGIFEVRTDGGTVYDKREDGYDVDDIVDRVGERLD